MRSEELLPVPEANELSSTVSCPVVGTAGSLHPHRSELHLMALAHCRRTLLGQQLSATVCFQEDLLSSGHAIRGVAFDYMAII